MCAFVRLRLVEKLTPTDAESLMFVTHWPRHKRNAILSFKTASVQNVQTEKLSTTIVTTFATACQHFGNFW